MLYIRLRNVNCPHQRMCIITAIWGVVETVQRLELPTSPPQGTAYVRNLCGLSCSKPGTGAKMPLGAPSSLSVP